MRARARRKVDAGTRIRRRGHFRVTIEITSRVIVVAAYNGSDNSGKRRRRVRQPRAADTHEIPNWRIVDFNDARGKIRAHENTRFPIPDRAASTSFSASPTPFPSHNG